MTDHLDSLPEPSDDELAVLGGLLARADAWDDPPRELEDRIVDAIGDEAAARPLDGIVPLPIATRLRRPSLTAGQVLAAAAAVALVVAGVAVLTARSGDGGAVVALAGTEASPGASAAAEVTATPAGLKIILDAEGLPGAPEGFVYEAWVGDGQLAVSAGTFHLRGGDDPIELWAGVTDPAFRRLWVTLEPVDDDLSPSGDARLRGEFSLD